MKYASAALLAALSLMGCSMGPDGNPNRQPYANDPGGTMAVKPATVGTVSYDPFAPLAPFADMQAGQPALNPPPPLTIPPPAANPPRRSR